jgi:hypothetical protein
MANRDTWPSMVVCVMIDGETLWLTTAIEDGSAQEGPPPPGAKNLSRGVLPSQ